MIYAKINLKIEFELNIPMQHARDVAEVQAQIDSQGGTDAFIAAMSKEVIENMSTPFSTGNVTAGTVEIVKI